MKKKLIVLCGALVLVVAAVSVTVASRSANSLPEMTVDSIEALTRDEYMPFFKSHNYTVKCVKDHYEVDFSTGQLIYLGTWETDALRIDCYSGGNESCSSLIPC